MLSHLLAIGGYGAGLGLTLYLYAATVDDSESGFMVAMFWPLSLPALVCYLTAESIRNRLAARRKFKAKKRELEIKKQELLLAEIERDLRR